MRDDKRKAKQEQTRRNFERTMKTKPYVGAASTVEI